MVLFFIPSLQKSHFITVNYFKFKKKDSKNEYLTDFLNF